MSKVIKITKTIADTVKLEELEQTAPVVMLQKFLKIEKQVIEYMRENSREMYEGDHPVAKILKSLSGGVCSCDDMKRTRSRLIESIFPARWEEYDRHAIDADKLEITFTKDIVEEGEVATETDNEGE